MYDNSNDFVYVVTHNTLPMMYQYYYYSTYTLKKASLNKVYIGKDATVELIRLSISKLKSSSFEIVKRLSRLLLSLVSFR